MVWTRVPEKNVLEVLLTFLLPLCIVCGFAALQTGTIRVFHRSSSCEESSHIRFHWGAATLLLWIAIAALIWPHLDVFETHDNSWASYLHSRFDAQSRSHLMTYEHLVGGIDALGWFLRWVVLPGLLFPLSNSAAHGLRGNALRRAVRTWIDWKWWLVVLVLALLGQALPQTFFTENPTGTVRAQVTGVLLKLIAAYLLAVLAWLLALLWSVQLFHGPDPSADAEEPQAAPPLLDPGAPQGIGGNA
jgi:hypothetical protein